MEEKNKNYLVNFSAGILALFLIFSKISKKKINVSEQNLNTNIVDKSKTNVIVEEGSKVELVEKVPIEKNKLFIEKKFDGYTNRFLDFYYVNSDWEQKAKTISDTIFQNKEKYVNVSSQLGKVPWYVIGIIHYLESDFSFNKHLHNGDPLSGRTVHVPRGRPLSNPTGESNRYTWEESAIDAIKMKMWHTWVDWEVKDILFRSENYNGRGYAKMGKLSPYIWSGSNYGVGLGKFTSDGVYDKNAVSKQVGVALILRKIYEKLNFVFENTQIQKEPIEEKTIFSKKEEKLKLYFAKYNIKYFQPKEFLTLGGGNEYGKCKDKNKLPPDDLLENIAKVAQYWDIVREKYEKKIIVNSVYRSPEYNSCLDGTASNSFHMKGMAADCSPAEGSLSELTKVISYLKNEGKIVGGWGVYPTFIHLDTRPSNVKFR